MSNSKILERQQLRTCVEEWRRAGERIVLANGNFDLLHVGHVRYLRGAKELGGKLMAFSEGSGRGATFTLELPAQQPKSNS